MRIGWVMGWGVPRAWFSGQVNSVFPEGDHVFFEPKDTVMEDVERSGAFDVVVGYSLGAHLLLAEAERVRNLGARVNLLAPFPAFASEEGKGGRVLRTQVRYMARWVRRDRAAALADFYARAGLDVTPEMANGIEMETLAAGLARLESGRTDGLMSGGWRMYAGTDDGLLDVMELKLHLPGLVVVAGGTHHPGALLRACKEAGL